MTPRITEHVDLIITTVEDMAKIYGTRCGRYDAEAINRGDIDPFAEADLKTFAESLVETFRLK